MAPVRLAWWAALLMGAAMLMALTFHGANARKRVGEARTAAVLAQERATAGADAVATLDGVNQARARSDSLTRSSEDAIRRTKGADMRLASDLNRLGRQRLCQRSAYSGEPECLQRPVGAKPAG